MSDRDDEGMAPEGPVVTGGDGGEPVELGDRRPKHISVTTAAGKRFEHGDAYVRHSASGFAVATEPDFPPSATTRYEKADLRRAEVTQHHSACFITTAAAGEGPQLDALRGFRDDAMSRTPVGRGLLVLYDVISPPIARTLSRHPESRTTRAIRWLVEGCAGFARRRGRSRSRTVRFVASVVLTLAYAIGIVLAVTGHAAFRVRERATGLRLAGGSEEQSGQPAEHRQDAEDE